MQKCIYIKLYDNHFFYNINLQEKQNCIHRETSEIFSQKSLGVLSKGLATTAKVFPFPLGATVN